LQQKWPQEYIPHERTLQRWFRQQGYQRMRQGRQPRRLSRGQHPHAVWELDSKEQIGLASGELVSWLVVSDEASGAVLQATVFPYRAGQPNPSRMGTTSLETMLCRLGVAAGDPCG
jgi:hypothetical protein